MTSPQIVWLRRDLRIADNPALYEAAKAGPVIPVYVLDDASAKTHAYGGASRWWLHHSLGELGKRFADLGSPLILRRGDAVQELTKLAEETDARVIQANRHYEPWWRNAQRAIAERFDLRLHDGNFLLPVGAVTTGSGAPYKIYTPFARTTRTQFPPRDSLPAPARLSAPAKAPSSDQLDSWNLLPQIPDWAGGLRQFWQVGEEAAHDRLAWWSGHVEGYQEHRNHPSKDKVSRLSPHLHFGEITPVQIWHHLAGNASEGWYTFESELIWRDYAQNTIAQFPVYGRENHRSAFDQFAWRDPENNEQAARDLAAWQQGKTGYPIVDAAMRQLWQTGWMHNRVRMITASFLIKHLLIDWRHGERWFWDTLVDADYASNAVNWQWNAGTGVDANMFVRIMAPLTQSKKFDCAGYIRNYVPELAALDEPAIHDPEEFGQLPTAYPAKIVGHREARARALSAYQIMKGA